MFSKTWNTESGFGNDVYMKFYKINSFYIISKMKNHKKIKSKLLKLIDKMPTSSLDKISNTDWSLAKEYKREYLHYFYKKITPCMNEIAKEFKSQRWEIHNGWFQQYRKQDSHPWHNHNNANFTNVYYLELPNKKMTTALKCNGSIVNVEAQEGDLVTFPAHIFHRSQPNISDKQKTVIAFNSDFYMGQ